jgi:hypothetical protein
MASSLWPAALVAAALGVLCPRQASAQRSGADASPCDARKQVEAMQKKAQFEQTIAKSLGSGALRQVDFDPCQGTAKLGADVGGCAIDADNGQVNANCPGASGDALAGAGDAPTGDPASAKKTGGPDWAQKEQDAIDNGNAQVKGRATMFGGPLDKSTGGWSSPTASGESTHTPGVAVNTDGNATDAANRSRLGGYWLMHMPDGDWVYRQTDLGPAGWTGNKIDLTAGSLPAHGISVTTPASWSNVNGTYLGKDPTYAPYNGKCVANCGGLVAKR